jgi:hypothetical protein
VSQGNPDAGGATRVAVLARRGKFLVAETVPWPSET